MTSFSGMTRKTKNENVNKELPTISVQYVDPNVGNPNELYFTRESKTGTKVTSQNSFRDNLGRIIKVSRSKLLRDEGTKERNFLNTPNQRPSDIYDTNHYTLARPLDDPAQISKILGPDSATIPGSDNEKYGNDTKMNENIRPFTWHNQLKRDIFQIKRRYLVGTLLLAGLIIGLGVGFILGFETNDHLKGTFCFYKRSLYPFYNNLIFRAESELLHLNNISECPPLSKIKGRCGQQHGGRCNKDLKHDALYCNLKMGRCEPSFEHNSATLEDVYDWKPESCKV